MITKEEYYAVVKKRQEENCELHERQKEEWREIARNKRMPETQRLPYSAGPTPIFSEADRYVQPQRHPNYRCGS